MKRPKRSCRESCEKMSHRGLGKRSCREAIFVEYILKGGLCKEHVSKGGLF